MLAYAKQTTWILEGLHYMEDSPKKENGYHLLTVMLFLTFWYEETVH